LQHQQHFFSHLEGSGKKLPPTPTKPSNVNLGKKLLSTSGRQLPRPITCVEKTFCNKSYYNEDYNYAYHSQDNLQLEVSGINKLIKDRFTQMHIINDFPNYQKNMNEASQISYNNYDRTFVDSQMQDTYKLVEKYNYNAEYQPSFFQLTKNSFENIYNEPYQDNPSLKDTESLPIYEQQQIQQMIKKDCSNTLSYDQNNTHQSFESMITQKYINEHNKDEYSCGDKYQEKYMNQSFQNIENSTCNKQIMTDMITDIPTMYNNDKISTDNKYNDPMVSMHDEQYTKQYKHPSVSVKVLQDTYQNFYTKKKICADNVSYNEEDNTRYITQDNTDICTTNDPDQICNEYSNHLFEDSFKDDFEDQYNLNLCKNVDQARTNLSNLFIRVPVEQTNPNGYTSSKKEYQQLKNDQDTLIIGTDKKKLFKCDISPLLQQNLVILDCEDVKQKDSCINLLSSIDNCQPKKVSNELSSEEENNYLHNNKDSSIKNYIHKPEQYNAIIKNVTEHIDVTSIDKNSISTNFIRNKSHKEELFNNDEYQNKDSQLKYQSHKNEQSRQNHENLSNQHLIQPPQKPKFMCKESYTSNHFSDDNYIKKQTYSQSDRNNLLDSIADDSYSTDSYHIKDHKQTIYGQRNTMPQPISRAESYQRGYFKDQNGFNDNTEIIFGSTAIRGYNETIER
jgi:hypothetical protein